MRFAKVLLLSMTFASSFMDIFQYVGYPFWVKTFQVWTIKRFLIYISFNYGKTNGFLPQSFCLLLVFGFSPTYRNLIIGFSTNLNVFFRWRIMTSHVGSSQLGLDRASISVMNPLVASQVKALTSSFNPQKFEFIITFVAWMIAICFSSAWVFSFKQSYIKYQVIINFSFMHLYSCS